MGKSRSRLAADWFAKLRVNEITQEVEHEDVVAEQEALDAAEAKIASDIIAAKALADSEMATAIAGATMASGDILTSLKTVDGAGSGLDADLLDGQQGSYYTGYTDTAIANLVDSSPATLDTLNELAAALGDDPNFATTVSTQIGTKLDSTANAVSASKLNTARTIALSGDVTGSITFDGSANKTMTTVVGNNSHTHTIANVSGLQTALDGKVDDSQVLSNVPSGAVFTDTVYTHPNYSGDDFSVDTGALTGATVVSDIDINVTTDPLGHVTDTNGVVSTRTLTLADLGFTGDSNATNYSHPSTHPATMITTTDEFAYSNSGNVQDVLDDLDQAIANVNAKDPVITLTGGVSGSGTMTNLGNVSINATVGNDSHTHDSRYYTESEADSRFVNASGDTMSGDLSFNSGANIHRSTHSSGYLVGSYNSVGANSAKSNPIYTIGSSYQPADTSLGTMYGIGYSNGDASFGGINSMLSGWGLYVAADGDARIGLDASNGIIRSTGVAYVNTNQRVFADNYHPNADKWTTARTLSLTGDVTGSTTWDGSGNASITATVNNIDGNTFVNSDSGNPVNADTIASNGVSYYTSGVTNFSGNATDGALYSQHHNSIWQHQIAGDYRSGQIAVRGKNNGTWTSWNKVWTQGNDGSGSGLDSDTVDGYHASTSRASANTIPIRNGSGYLELGWINTTSGNTTNASSDYYVNTNDGYIRKKTLANVRSEIMGVSSGSSFLRSDASDTHTGTLTLDVVQVGNELRLPNNTSLTDVSLTGTSDEDTGFNWSGAGAVNYISNGTLKYNLNNVWHSGNDGSGSGLDADLLDGVHASSFLRADVNSNRELATNVNSSSYQYSAIELREYNKGSAQTGAWSEAPRLAFHWGGRVASSIALATDGDICIMDNPGSGYEDLRMKDCKVYGTVIESSDARLKENVRPITDALSKVTSLQGVHYNKIETPELEEIGFIAQEVEEVVPEIVTTDDTEEGMKAVSYARTVALLVEAMKEQQQQIDELKHKLGEL